MLISAGTETLYSQKQGHTETSKTTKVLQPDVFSSVANW